MSNDDDKSSINKNKSLKSLLVFVLLKLSIHNFSKKSVCLAY